MKRELKALPINMYVGMVILALLCIAQGLRPDILYRYLPEAMTEANHNLYTPWELWNVLQALLLLGFSGLAFVLMKNVITPHKALNLDFDWFYRLLGRAGERLIFRPSAFIDGFWTNVYETVGLRLLKLYARFTVFFDRWIIDGLIDNAAYGVRGLGRLGAGLQSGRLQQYLAMMMVFLAVILALVWFG